MRSTPGHVRNQQHGRNRDNSSREQAVAQCGSREQADDPVLFRTAEYHIPPVQHYGNVPRSQPRADTTDTYRHVQ